MHISKWAQARQHFFRNLIGFPAYFWAHPKFALQLFAIRAQYFSTRRLQKPILTPDQFLIESPEELVSYWSFFVEKETLACECIQALISEPDPTVIDIGANAGLFTHRVWTLNPKTRFIVFEPLPKMAEKIARWGKTTGADLTLYNKAVADRVGTFAFYASADNDTAASLIKPEGTKKNKLDVPVVTLDSVITDEKILLVKIDAEGVECEALSGARQILERTRFLIVEAHTKTDLERLKAHLTSKWQCGRIGAGDYLFKRLSQ
jgi:FkbM family methyltransferase